MNIYLLTIMYYCGELLLFIINLVGRGPDLPMPMGNF